MPCVLNAANEVVVEAFLTRQISFLQMPEIIEKAMERVTWIEKPGLDDLVATNAETRRITKLLIENKK
jgi:1-deoxy-D-xylulose-5-phosphate reductoisomerase